MLDINNQSNLGLNLITANPFLNPLKPFIPYTLYPKSFISFGVQPDLCTCHGLPSSSSVAKKPFGVNIIDFFLANFSIIFNNLYPSSFSKCSMKSDAKTQSNEFFINRFSTLK